MKPILSDKERESREMRLIQERIQRKADAFGKGFSKGPVGKVKASPYKD